jgi:anti-sigma B factor antagonist
MRFQTASERIGDTQVIAVAGEVDLATGPELERALLGLPRNGAASVVVDLTECGFMDSTGISILVRAHQRLGRAGGRLAVVSAKRPVLRVFELTGLDQLLAIYPSRTAALNGDGHG